MWHRQWGQVTVSPEIHGFAQFPEEILCIDIGGATVLEQILFNKMMLTSSFYHHHKVRSSFRLLVHVMWSLQTKGLTLNGVKLDRAANYLQVDDSHILACPNKEQDKGLREVMMSLKNRVLPQRALVITKKALLTEESSAEYFRIRDSSQLRSRLEKDIVSQAGIENVFLDFPDEPTFAASGLQSVVRLSQRNYVILDSLYPLSGWVTGYAEFRYRAYVFAPPKYEEKVSKAAISVLADAHITLDTKLARELAKLPLPDVNAQ